MKTVLKTFSTVTLILTLALAWLFMTASFAGGPVKDRRVHIAIVDTGIKRGHEEWYCRDALPKDFTGLGIYDINGHGTNIAGIVTKDLSPKTHCLMIAKWYHDKSQRVWTGPPIAWAVKNGAKYINLSFYGVTTDEVEKAAIENALRGNVRVVVSAGNDHHDLEVKCDAYPGCYKLTNTTNFYVIGDFNARGNYGGPINEYENGANVLGWDNIVMSGSSQSAAIFTNKLVKSEYPTRHY